MPKLLRKVVERLPGSQYLFYIYRKAKLRFYYGAFKGKEKLFSDYYKVWNWGPGESRSGSGSTLAFTESLRKELPEIFDKYNLKTILDAPCGDLNWMKLVIEKNPIEYKGADIVRPMIEGHKRNYSYPNTTFYHLDITKDALLKADIWLCRDCLIHFSNKDIIRTLTNYLKSDIPYLLTTTYVESKVNVNIITGDHRFLNLELPPFNFPKPQTYINDWVPGTPVKKLGLWTKEELEKFIIALSTKR